MLALQAGASCPQRLQASIESVQQPTTATPSGQLDLQLREMMEYQQNRDRYDNLEDAAASSSGHRGTYRQDNESSDASQIHARNGDEDDSDDDSQEAMTPRGVYVQRCLCGPTPAITSMPLGTCTAAPALLREVPSLASVQATD
jgi:hypothetical protein